MLNAPVHVHAAPTLIWFCNELEGAVRTFTPAWMLNTKEGIEMLFCPNDQLSQEEFNRELCLR